MRTNRHAYKQVEELIAPHLLTVIGNGVAKRNKQAESFAGKLSANSNVH